MSDKDAMMPQSLHDFNFLFLLKELCIFPNLSRTVLRCSKLGCDLDSNVKIIASHYKLETSSFNLVYNMTPKNIFTAITKHIDGLMHKGANSVFSKIFRSSYSVCRSW